MRIDTPGAWPEDALPLLDGDRWGVLVCHGELAVRRRALAGCDASTTGCVHLCDHRRLCAPSSGHRPSDRPMISFWISVVPP